ncbi:unnamed protein product [Acanthosepion pharaonis]|uniref:PHD-type domain-containing protein n=1 Tax=Acanthosepion pharaonis TaxID=158019 RepID=A0A812E567_ACAPH|nr:unnamed protein product [Sepia pharaonis]
MSLPSSLLECDRCFTCGSINKRKRIRHCSNCQRSFHLSCVGLTRNASVSLVVWSCSHCLSLSALQDSVIHQHNEPTQRDASEVLRATSLLRQFRKVPLKIPKSVRIAAADAKLTEGDASAAVRVLAAFYTILATTPEVVTALRRKHPASPSDVRFVQMENNDSNIEISKEAMVAVLKSFSGSSSGGVDDLQPGHIKDLISAHTAEAGEHLKTSITALFNTLLRLNIFSQLNGLKNPPYRCL